jgi:hypothetical protein
MMVNNPSKRLYKKIGNVQSRYSSVAWSFLVGPKKATPYRLVPKVHTPMGLDDLSGIFASSISPSRQRRLSDQTSSKVNGSALILFSWLRESPYRHRRLSAHQFARFGMAHRRLPGRPRKAALGNLGDVKPAASDTA